MWGHYGMMLRILQSCSHTKNLVTTNKWIQSTETQEFKTGAGTVANTYVCDIFNR